MTLPANLRVNTSVPFPSQVMGIGGIGIAKQQGIWTVSLNYGAIQVQTPLPANYATDYVLVWDSIANTYFTMSLSAAASGGIVGGTVQRAVTALPVTIAATDRILHLNLTAAGTITLPSYTTRGGVGLLFKDVGLQATTFPITIAAAAGETIDSLFPSIPLSTNGQAIRLVPANDGVNTGWFSE